MSPAALTLLAYVHTTAPTPARVRGLGAGRSHLGLMPDGKLAKLYCLFRSVVRSSPAATPLGSDPR